MPVLNVADLFRKSARGEISCSELVRLLAGDSRYREIADPLHHDQESAQQTSNLPAEGTTEVGEGEKAAHHEIEEDRPELEQDKDPEIQVIGDSDQASVQEVDKEDDGEGAEGDAEAAGQEIQDVTKGDADSTVDDDTFRDMRELDVAFPEAGG